ncbi:MAG TPA: hypothetical protein VI259_15325 [Gemmatimonadaceae bacterium]
MPSDVRVERPATISDFYTATRGFLLEYEAEHGLMLSGASAFLVAPAGAYWSLARTREG